MKSKMFSGKNIAFVSIVLILAAIAFFFLWKHFHHSDEEEAAPPAELKVPVVRVVSKALFREDQLPGEINAYQDVLVYPKVPGFIEWIGVDRGSVVKKDQLMLRIYAPEYLARRNEGVARVAASDAALAAEESKLEDIKAELKRRQANLLADQSTYQRVYNASLVPGVIADNDVVQWSQSVRADQAYVNTVIKRINAKAHEVEKRKQDLAAEKKAYENYSDFAAYLEIRAPFDGYVTDRKLHVGSFVGPDGSGAYPPICRVKQLDLLRIVTPVPEVDTAGVIPGSQVKFSVSSFPGRMFVGTVARISNNLDKDTRTMPVELNYFNPKYSILPGMFCKVYWPTHQHQASLFVPITAVVTTPLQTFVCKVQDSMIDWVKVRKGQIMGDLVEIIGSIQEGDLVAKEGHESLQDQSKVKAIIEPVPTKLKTTTKTKTTTTTKTSVPK